MDEQMKKTLPTRGKHLCRALTVLFCIPLFLGILYGCRCILLEPPKPLPGQTKAETALKPLTADEQAALRWLDHVLGPLTKEEEQKWWQTGKLQFGLSSTRYHIAFAGYAAAALGYFCAETMVVSTRHNVSSRVFFISLVVVLYAISYGDWPAAHGIWLSDGQSRYREHR